MDGIDPETADVGTAYNLTGDDLHTFFVATGSQEVLVHNYCKPPKDLPGFPDAKRAKPKTPYQGGGGLRARWVDSKGRIYEWDSKKGTVEVYSRNGKRHLGEFDPNTGKQVGDPVSGRTVDP